MKTYKLVIDRNALQDIQDITDWYNSQSKGLGARFQKQVKLQINKLRDNPNAHTIRYADIRCNVVKKFPFLIHYLVDEAAFLVEVFAVIHTSRNPKIWEQ